MQSLFNKQVVLGVSGGIAAYKSAELIRRLRDAGAEVRVVMTNAAREFITPLTLQALSGHPVHGDLLDPAAEAAMGHIELARWADLVLIAPATADMMARLAQGRGDDLLTTLVLATDAPVAIAPAMNQAMWRDPATQHNLALLLERDVKVFGPGDGGQACGDVGPGRMLEPTDIAARAAECFERGLLAGRHVLINAGPTREAIDPVRYISNHSSGKMGFALAEAAAEAGARVTLVAGPVNLPTPARVQRVDVVSAQQMLDACLAALPADLFIASAAVADYRPDACADQKLKKTPGSDDGMTLTLVRNPDILATLASHSERPGFCVGFAAETQDLLGYARDKLQRKNLDLIIANDVSQSGIGFNSDDNAVTLIDRDLTSTHLPQASKQKLARDLISRLATRLDRH
ncbi:MAG: bifunctional phosphopantothenoylcysteine decarboxylase/phosphopantothenate--cysteine ligase CoaBC [Pseudomonadales bacterium]|jgi:phosphopantothenoylcysteine decarboxylase / phosphopantothenate---cysteine ligase|uniref:bifunctional phosphopantothenoylcysteine decarboxylase/phosphopantothenate--cysteine ligase CoaBC n=1 Tax=Halopseudomonas aestusnigri TaxID=857252 RepID=UPI000C46F22A|nr:bifunctional phosphopantothenoylcysteine decarboxylase/phosphopantothenate--cysteine ligase CoaBC [Halopseudomonas aestusnigri]MAG99448.1 bifunctional phosphopantothenoylcysteine decarboxylase/phosphopantothenate--cysteine ligase CoaBC [Pseudomonadales bacterium]HBT57787.1 bifunctional phosphopantothenoylcysteine decarboxylase/phosphopantothenate--cysteine ligase CoaBC [Pseudomonas sp.]MAP76568.1 bifunctional phosphopantothenoylcysteine decarboxylase/phosphopantothenate--cysteine ligase CoaBC|tara:strand:+ start:1270 stop:2481 length:1212 start_codon:yes stop_codon:yes gene_type:complete